MVGSRLLLWSMSPDGRWRDCYQPGPTYMDKEGRNRDGYRRGAVQEVLVGRQILRIPVTGMLCYSLATVS